MINKFGTVIIVAAVALVVGTASDASAQTPQQNRINTFTRKLNSLPNQQTAYPLVRRLVVRLSQLVPNRANTYFRTGTRKLLLVQGSNVQAKNFSRALLRAVTQVVRSADLPPATLNKIIRAVDRTETQYKPPYVAALTRTTFVG